MHQSDSNPKQPKKSPMKNSPIHFEEKSDYERQLIEFTKAVNKQSENLRKADSDQVSIERSDLSDALDDNSYFYHNKPSTSRA
jgi:hypothetical protein